MQPLKQKNKQPNPAAVISISFLVIIVIGTLLLMMPFSSASNRFTDPLTALFTATSATCVTGLVVVDTGSYWSVIGQIIILLMIQIGGLGLVTFTSFFSFLIRKKPELHTIQVASESVNTSGFYDVKYMVKYVLAISFVCELIGAAILSASYVPKFGAKGIYLAIYLSIAAFCNAGFDIMGMFAEPFSSLTTLSNDPITVIVIPVLIIAGGLGFLVWTNLIEFNKKKKLEFQSKLVLITTAVLIVSGMLITLITEWNNPKTLGGESFIYKLGNSFFQSVTLRTAGFNAIDIEGMTPMMKVFSIFYMFIGAAPGSTGGGIKLTTIAIIIMTISSVLSGRSDTIAMGRKIEHEVVYKALTVAMVFVFLIIIASLAIYNLNPGFSGLDTAYEVTSAISTSGLSSGVTAKCNDVSRAILIIIMFIGRVGPVSLAFSISINNKRNKNEIYPVGKVMVG
ncbi:MAG: TrkH family potassium uptake protein [Oscillospiraceae bacterium]